MCIDITTPEGHKITGELQEEKPDRQLLIICHGYKITKEHPALKAIAQKLHKKGRAVFTFNFSDDETGLNLPQQVSDVRAVIDHFKTYDEIILLAGSFGALSTAIVAADSPKVKSLITNNGFFGGHHLGGHLRWVYLTFRLLAFLKAKYRAIWVYYKKNFRPDHIMIPTLVMHSLADKTVSIRQSRTFFSALPGKKQFTELQRADHELLEGNEINTIVNTIDTWIRTLN